MTDIVEIWTTVDSEEAAGSIARTLVERRLAACVQVLGPIRSTYWWQGAIETATEWTCLAKTPAGRYEEIEAAIREIHPYDVPEILAAPVERGNPAYLEWVRRETVG